MPTAARPAARLLALAALALTPLPAAHATGATRATRAACTSTVTAPATPTKGADPFGTDECLGVRPGALLNSGSEQCTFGFVFQGSDRRRYVATAGHCAFATDPDRTVGFTQTWKPGTGPAVTDASGRRAGRFAYATLSGQFKDFALVRLDRGVTANPQMCHFGGPTRLTTEVHNEDVQVHHYGHGVALGDTVPARTGDAFFGLYRPDYIYFYGAAVEGDSGSPVIDATGAAVGIITDRSTPFTGNVGVNRLADHLAAAQKALRIKLTLVTAPLL